MNTRNNRETKRNNTFFYAQIFRFWGYLRYNNENKQKIISIINYDYYFLYKCIIVPTSCVIYFAYYINTNKIKCGRNYSQH